MKTKHREKWFLLDFTKLTLVSCVVQSMICAKSKYFVKRSPSAVTLGSCRDCARNSYHFQRIINSMSPQPQLWPLRQHQLENLFDPADDQFNVNFSLVNIIIINQKIFPPINPTWTVTSSPNFVLLVINNHFCDQLTARLSSNCITIQQRITTHGQFIIFKFLTPTAR